MTDQEAKAAIARLQKERDERRDRALAKAIAAQAALWGALVAVNGFIVTAGAIIGSTPSKPSEPMLPVIVVICAVGTGSTLLCFILMKMRYIHLLNSLNRLEKMTPEQQIEATKAELSRKEFIPFYEKLAIGFTILALFLFTWLFFQSFR